MPAALAGACLLLLGALSTCSPKVPLLQRVETIGVLRVATFNSPTTYYVGPTGPVGFEHDLTREFAESLGLKLEILIAEDESEVLDLVLTGRAHLGAGLSITPTTEAEASFTPPLRSLLPPQAASRIKVVVNRRRFMRRGEHPLALESGQGGDNQP